MGRALAKPILHDRFHGIARLEPCSDSIGTEKALVLLFEIGNDIGAILRALHLIEHLRAWHERSGIDQPTVQCRLVPGQAGILEGLGIVVALDDSGMTSDHATMAWSHVVFVNGMAVHAALIERLASNGIALGCADLDGNRLRKDGSICHGDSENTQGRRSNELSCGFRDFVWLH